MRLLLPMLLIFLFCACKKELPGYTISISSLPAPMQGEPFYVTISKRLSNLSKKIGGSRPLFSGISVRSIGLMFYTDSTPRNNDDLAVMIYREVFAGYKKEDILSTYANIEIDYWHYNDMSFVLYDIDTSYLFKNL